MGSNDIYLKLCNYDIIMILLTSVNGKGSCDPN